MATKAANKSEKENGEVTPVVIESFKGFDINLQCRGYQFEIGQSYKVGGKIKTCKNGFHACSNPLDVWCYYGPSNSRFAIVEQSGMTIENDQSKIASASITIKAELTLPEIIQRGVDWIFKKVNFANAPATNTGNYSAATNTGDQSAATNTGKEAVAMASGYQSRAMGGDGCALFVIERDDNFKIIAAWAGIVGRDGIKPEVFYTLTNGKPVEWRGA